ncbi:hypothetical protein JAAARDRAFT_198618 [Jaapia argillacea MUCL 33604]|uniref:Uncharacterized protein n=1 Tax=Jaapia argillacea MUCL 33604 TaxID=933084 RepID=A0A067PB51_9AGAM|nr:hypothetical protein JAAARDRAFT_198618 [Jaapia argillacea MUCL 33604]
MPAKSWLIDADDTETKLTDQGMKKYSKKICEEFDVAFPHNKPARIFDTKDGWKVAVGEETEAEALARTAIRPKQIYNWIRNNWKKCRPDVAKSLPKSLQLQSIPVTTAKRASSACDLFQRDHPQIAQESWTNAAVTRAMDHLKETNQEKWEEYEQRAKELRDEKAAESESTDRDEAVNNVMYNIHQVCTEYGKSAGMTFLIIGAGSDALGVARSYPCSSDPSFNLKETKTRTALDQLCNHLVSHFESNPIVTGTTSVQEPTEDTSESEPDENDEPDVSQAAEGSKGEEEQKAEEEAREEAARKAGEEARKEALRIAEEEVSKEAEGARMAEEEARKQAARMAEEQVSKKAEAARMAEEEARKQAVRIAEEQVSKEAEAARMAEEEARKEAQAARMAEEAALKVAERKAEQDALKAATEADGKKTGGHKKKVVAKKKSTDTNVQDTDTGGRRASGRLKRPHEPELPTDESVKQSSSKKRRTRSAGKPVAPTQPSVSGTRKIRIPPRPQAAAKSTVPSVRGRGHDR